MTTGYASLTASTVKQEIRSLKKQARKINASPAKARAFLIQAGILDKSGKKLAPHYRD